MSEPISAREVIPWWFPTWPAFLSIGLYVMSFWVLWILAPAKGQSPSELFKALAEGIVLTGFLNGVVSSVYTTSRDSQKKNETIAAQARVIAGQTGPGPVA